MIIIILKSIFVILNSDNLSRLIVISLIFLSSTNILRLYDSYKTFGEQIIIREKLIDAALRDGRCGIGIKISAINFPERSKFINNRDEWVKNSMDQVNYHYGCKLIYD